MNQFKKKNVMHDAHDLIDAFVKQSPGHENWRELFVHLITTKGGLIVHY